MHCGERGISWKMEAFKPAASCKLSVFVRNLYVRRTTPTPGACRSSERYHIRSAGIPLVYLSLVSYKQGCPDRKTFVVRSKVQVRSESIVNECMGLRMC